MQITYAYILSQLFVIFYYLIVISTYQLKNRRTILVLNLIAVLIMGVSYYLLSAYTGVAMVIVGAIRNILFYFDFSGDKENTKIGIKNIMELIFITFILIILTIYTYDGFFSLMSVFATYLYTLSIWQKNTKVYKIFGIPVGLTGVLYNIYIFSVLGIVLESISFLSAIIGFCREMKSTKKA